MRDEHEPGMHRSAEFEGRATAELDPDWSSLLRYLQTARGFDFNGYKTSSLTRRVRKRMASLGLEHFAAYQDYLEVHPDEFVSLFNTILINVTGFFRDPEAWELIQTSVLPTIIASKPASEQIRVWCAGCATGEEAYTIAMLLAEQLGTDGFRERVKIYATDVDEEALDVARHGAYSPAQVQGVPAPLLDRYFEQVDGRHVFRPDLRRQVIYGRHDVIGDAPISRIDLLSCRNTLMYFTAETQARVLARFHFSLNEGGYLFLGRAETLMPHGLPFQALDLKRRIVRKVPGTAPLRERREARDARGDRTGSSRAHVFVSALETSPIAQMVVDGTGQVIVANGGARTLLGLRAGDGRRRLEDLQLSERPVDLRSLITRSQAEHRQITVTGVEWTLQSGDVRWLDLHVAPLTDAEGVRLGTAITFTDMTEYRRLQHELEHSRRKLDTAYDELQSTTMAMGTMNQELRSTNAELHTITDELRRRGDQLELINASLQSMLASMRTGVAVVDRELRVLAWNQRAEDLWGLAAHEAVGRKLLDLVIGLPVDRIRPALRACLDGVVASQQVELEAVDRLGRTIPCEVSVTPLRAVGGDIHGAILLMEVAGSRG